MKAKKTNTMRANWSYEDVETKVWNIKSLTDFGNWFKELKKTNKCKYITYVI